MARGLRFEPWGTPDTPRAHGPHGPRSFLDGPGASKPWGAFGLPCSDGLAWGPGVTGRKDSRLATQWALGSKHKMYIWHVCIYLYLGEP